MIKPRPPSEATSALVAPPTDSEGGPLSLAISSCLFNLKVKPSLDPPDLTSFFCSSVSPSHFYNFAHIRILFDLPFNPLATLYKPQSILFWLYASLLVYFFAARVLARED
jgi:hypothetical protein